jgi:chloramphenicol 3-O-phosphotransferase
MERRKAPQVIVVTRIQAAGKSTVARLLARRFARGAHVEADALHRMIVSGEEWVREPGEPDGEAARQLRLRLHHMCLLGRSFYEAGFTAVLDDIIVGERWVHLQEELRGLDFSLVVLAPSIEAVLRRDANRATRQLGEAWAVYLDGALRETMAGMGHWVDSSDQTPEQTVHEVVAQQAKRTE